MQSLAGSGVRVLPLEKVSDGDIRRFLAELSYRCGSGLQLPDTIESLAKSSSSPCKHGRIVTMLLGLDGSMLTMLELAASLDRQYRCQSVVLKLTYGWASVHEDCCEYRLLIG